MQSSTDHLTPQQKMDKGLRLVSMLNLRGPFWIRFGVPTDAFYRMSVELQMDLDVHRVAKFEKEFIINEMVLLKNAFNEQFNKVIQEIAEL